jgi:hypothetical protein
MTHHYPNSGTDAQFIRCSRRIKSLACSVVLLLFGVFAGSASAQQTVLTYDDGDVFIGFICTDRTRDYLVDIGPPNQFRDATAGSTFTVNTGNLLIDLMTIFGSDWYTRIDEATGQNAVLWALVSGRVFEGNGDPTDTLYSTNPSINPWLRNFTQGTTSSLIAGMANNGYAGNLSTVNNPHAMNQNANNPNSYAQFQPPISLISFQTWNPANQGIPSATLYFDRILPGSNDPSTLLGFFTLNNSGQLTFTGGSGGGTPTPTPTTTPTPTPPHTPTPTPTPCAACTPTPTPTISPTPTASPTATESPTPTATPAATESPTPAASPTPVGTPTVLGNISTRLRVETGSNVLIGGFIVTGAQSKRVIVRALGTSLTVSGHLADPYLELRDSSGNLIRSNDNWRDNQEQEIMNTGLAPANDLEAAIVATLPGNNAAYTAIVSGVNDTTGIGLVEVYDLNSAIPGSQLANISTRGLVQIGSDAMIAGTIVVGPTSQWALVRALGPSLPVTGALADPYLELRDNQGNVVASCDNWHECGQEQQIIASGAPPSNDLESAIVAPLQPFPAAYTAIVSGVNNSTGVGLIEIYAIPEPMP